MSFLPPFSLDGKVAIVTGGSDGIGKGIAIGLAEAGAKVVIVARRQWKIDEALEQVRSLGPDAFGVSADVTKPDDVASMVQATIDRFGRIDILANIAGGSFGSTFKRGPLLEIDVHDFNEAFNVNVTSVFLCSRAVAPKMIEQRGGVIINMASVGAREYRPPETGFSVYGMTKAAVMHPTRSMAHEWAPHVRVNCLNVGHVLTERRKASEPEERIQRSLAEIKIGRFGETSDIAAAAIYLASPAGEFVNGAFLDIHGGY